MSRARELARLLPDCLVLLRRLARDQRVPRRAKLALVLLVPYLASPIDLIPDFLPIVGQLDDAALVLLVLRYVVRSAGSDVLDDLWPGTPSGLSTLRRLLRVAEEPEPAPA
jgi:uncharacterized membrane protein YkvA (DUF1232 family)